MEAGGRTSSSRRERAKSPGSRAPAAAPIAPIYKRLPHGPHRLGRKEVVRHQRARIHGAMIEAVARNGYEETSVKQVIALAGVSRRSFYEHFANKHECFLATFDLVVHGEVKRIRRAYLNASGSLQERLRMVFESLVEGMSNDRRKAISLVLVEAQTTGTAGTLRLRKAATTFEQMLSLGFTESPETPSPLPTPIVRGIIGGLHGAIANVLRASETVERTSITEEMLQWTLLFQTPDAAEMADRMAAQLTKRMREISLASARRPIGDPQTSSADVRERLLHNVLRLAAANDYRELTTPQIADSAGVPIDSFFEVFADKDDCYLAAIEMISDELLAIAAHPDLISDDWPQTVRRVIGRLMCYLAEHPLYARTVAQEAFFAGPQAVERILELARCIAVLLTEGAPTQPRSALAVEGVAGALWHTIRCQVAGGRIQLLAALSDYLSYVVLAPFIGAEKAIEVVTEEQLTSQS